MVPSPCTNHVDPWGFESKDDFLENFGDVKSDLYDVFDEASINLDDGSFYNFNMINQDVS